eukprot:scaffold232477_cov33-Tisochrysis_lutea.AAC.3
MAMPPTLDARSHGGLSTHQPGYSRRSHVAQVFMGPRVSRGVGVRLWLYRDDPSTVHQLAVEERCAPAMEILHVQGEPFHALL